MRRWGNVWRQVIVKLNKTERYYLKNKKTFFAAFDEAQRYVLSQTKMIKDVEVIDGEQHIIERFEFPVTDNDDIILGCDDEVADIIPYAMAYSMGITENTMRAMLNYSKCEKLIKKYKERNKPNGI